jgi:hypothetical protein
MTKHEQTIRQYLRELLARRESAGAPFPKGWHYHGSEDFLLRHGVIFPTEGGHATGHSPGECYAISRKNTRTYPGYLYAEGLAMMPGGAIIGHAWNVRPNGTIFDQAWAGLNGNIEGGAYFGVAFKTPRVRPGQYPSVLMVTRNNRDNHPVFSKLWERNRWNPQSKQPQKRSRKPQDALRRSSPPGIRPGFPSPLEIGQPS